MMAIDVCKSRKVDVSLNFQPYLADQLFILPAHDGACSTQLQQWGVSFHIWHVCARCGGVLPLQLVSGPHLCREISTQGIMHRGECELIFSDKLSCLLLLQGGGGFVFGYNIGVMSGALALLEEDFSLSPVESGLVMSALAMGSVLGCLVGGPLCDSLLGRWSTIQMQNGLFLLGAVLTAGAPTLAVLVLGRCSGNSDCAHIMSYLLSYYLSLHHITYTANLFICCWLFPGSRWGWPLPCLQSPISPICRRWLPLPSAEECPPLSKCWWWSECFSALQGGC